jgi:hypothetical protein
MPVVRIRALPQPAGFDASGAVTAVSSSLAALLDEDPAGTWTTWETIEPGWYAEGSAAPAVQPRSTHPPLVSLTAFEGRADDLVERMLEEAEVAPARDRGGRLDAPSLRKMLFVCVLTVFSDT